tara:strand:- start:124 stop:1209 length:1086 start_codon:yes stop_codon:yes gene_type:complete
MNNAINKCLIIVPSLTPNGPVKGAIALANGLSELGVKVTFVALKKGPGANSLLLPDITLHELPYSSLFSLLQMRAYVLKILSQSRSVASETVVISMCFSADLINILLPRDIKKIVSVRGDLKENYTMDHGAIGRILAYMHYRLLNFFDLVVAMNIEMMDVLARYGCRRIVMIPNFINEFDFTNTRTKKIEHATKKIVFVGSLTTRKKPFLLLEVVNSLIERGLDLMVFFVGDGPLKDELVEGASKSKNDQIRIIGFHEFPTDIVKDCDIMVLPSLSEGTPRAIMEALYLGVPCVMRNLSSNDNLVIDDVNGYLFENDKDLEIAIVKALSLAKESDRSHSLLDESFSQIKCCKNYLEAINQL